MRPIGVWAISGSRSAGKSSIGAVMGVSMTPGATAFTRMPSPTHCLARLCVSVTRPALADP